MHMIEVRNLKTEYAYGEPFVVGEAGFSAGQITAVIGRNGSGKSTLLKTLAGQKNYSGSILISGKECRDYNPIERAKEIAFLPQSVKGLNLDVKTLAEHGRFPYHGNFRKMTGEDREKIEKALLLTGMKEYADRELKELSGGERQRAYLAMVIAQDSPMILMDEPSMGLSPIFVNEMILMDEPTTYMDHLHRESFFGVLKQLAGEGKGIVMVCHDIEQSFAYSDRIVLMENRRLEFAGTPAELVKKEELMRRNFGVAMRRTDGGEALYPYGLKR